MHHRRRDRRHACEAVSAVSRPSSSNSALSFAIARSHRFRHGVGRQSRRSPSSSASRGWRPRPACVGGQARTISTRSASVSDGEFRITGSAMVSTSRASLLAISRGSFGEFFSATASARRTSTAASCAMMAMMPSACARSSGESSRLFDAAANLVRGVRALLLGRTLDQGPDVAIGEVGAHGDDRHGALALQGGGNSRRAGWDQTSRA